MSDKEQDYHDAVQHVSGDDGAADLFQAAGDVGTPPDKFEAQGHETVAHHKQRVQVPGLSDAAILTEEGASLPQDTTAGNVKLQGAH